MDFEAVRKIGMALPDVNGTATSRGVSLKVKGRLIACTAIHKSAEPNSLMVRVDPKQRAALVGAEPDIYYFTDHYRNYPAVLVRLSRIKRPELKKLLGTAWQFVRDRKIA